MRILFITRKYPPSVGGMELFAHDLQEALAAETEVSLLAWGGTGRVKAVLVALPYLACKATLRLLRGGIDVVHMQDGLLAPTGYVVSKLFRKPFTVTVHGLDITYKNPLFKIVVPWAVRHADRVFCISQAAAEEAQKRGVSPDKITVIPLAVRDELYGKSDRTTLLAGLKLPKESQILVTVGRLVKRKGVAWFIENVLPVLVKKYPNVVYLVVGEGNERPAIEAAVQSTGLQKNVCLAGKLDGELYTAAYNGANVFVMPNISVPGDIEGFGLVLLEAALCKLPIVAADIEGIKDAVADDKNGVLVPSKNIADFQSAISRFLDDPSSARQFGEQSRAYTLDHYQWPVIAKSYIRQYEHLQSRG